MTGVRWLLATILGILGAVAALAAVAFGYAKTELLAPEPFAVRTLAALESPAVRDYVSEQLTATLAAEGLARPNDQRLVQNAMAALVESDAFAPVFRRSVEAAHTQVLNGDEELELDLTRAAGIAERELRRVDPRLADAAKPRLQGLAVTLANDTRVAQVVEVTGRLEAAAYILPPIAVALLVAALGLARRRPLAATLIGVALTLAAIAGGLAVNSGRSAVTEEVAGAQRPAARATWEALIGDARLWAAGLAAAGLLVGAAGAWAARRGRRRPSSTRRTPPAHTASRTAASRGSRLGGSGRLRDRGTDGRRGG